VSYVFVLYLYCICIFWRRPPLTGTANSAMARVRLYEHCTTVHRQDGQEEGALCHAAHRVWPFHHPSSCGLLSLYLVSRHIYTTPHRPHAHTHMWTLAQQTAADSGQQQQPLAFGLWPLAGFGCSCSPNNTNNSTVQPPVLCDVRINCIKYCILCIMYCGSLMIISLYML
jgi:hypothetical protein